MVFVLTFSHSVFEKNLKIISFGYAAKLSSKPFAIHCRMEFMSTRRHIVATASNYLDMQLFSFSKKKRYSTRLLSRLLNIHCSLIRVIPILFSKLFVAMYALAL
jgi:hypothetical protein